MITRKDIAKMTGRFEHIEPLIHVVKTALEEDLKSVNQLLGGVRDAR